ncbi:cysteine desulfurase-like protein [Nocardioides sp. SOB77]|uniref:Cysteine desulfurase-like protein n=1 Tax=Nocardioides oceani TaxID=3058369 RepID=A0ABT8F9S4_9ACTN|nr:cysteine desulfurase-like protein [Nocardioides oceani]MDN4171325.1 cysteine desulfurase-like protein [Nocardioides oceani]
MDVDRIRACFPALDLGAAHFDGPGGSQVPRQVADAVAAAMTAGLGNRGTTTEAEARTERVVAEARTAAGDLLGTDPRGVVLGRSMTQLTFDLARTLARAWGPGDEVVVTRLDHDANIRPWVIAAERAGATVRWLGFDPATAQLDDLAPLLSERTRLVAFTAASNLLGTRPDVRRLADAAHEVGALVHLDAVHLAPHAPVDRVALGADLLACSPYKFFGPHLGVLAADPAFLETLHPDKLLPSTDAVPERFELGTLPHELLAGVTAAVDFMAGLEPGATGTRRERLVASMTALEAHEDALLDHLLDGLRAVPGVTLHGAAVAPGARRTPTVLLTLAGHAPADVARHLASVGVNAPAGHFYALEASRHAGLGDTGGVRAGLAAYTTVKDVDRLVAGVAELARA